MQYLAHIMDVFGVSTNGNPIYNPNTLHGTVARDAFGYALGYYQGDFKPIGYEQTYSNVNVSGFSWESPSTHQLYNGNIGQMRTGLLMPNATPIGAAGAQTLSMAYKYDQLHRIKEQRLMKYFEGDHWTATPLDVSFGL
jgi:hypothetical protein